MCELFRTHFETFPSGLPFETLCRFISGPYDKLAEMALFWLPALYREDPRTFDTLMRIATGDARPERRLGAFGLAFFHFHNVPAAVPTLVEVARAEPDDSKKFFQVLGGLWSIPSPPYASARSDAISRTSNSLRRGRIFAELCRKAGIDSSPWTPKGENIPFFSFIDDFLSGMLPKNIMRQLVWKSMTPGERKFSSNIDTWHAFRAAEKARLEKLLPCAAETVERWLDEAWANTHARFGFYGWADAIATIAVESLDESDTSEAAERIRGHAALLRKLESGASEEIFFDPNLRKLDEEHPFASGAAAERAFFLLRDGQETDWQTALTRAMIDTFGL